PATVTVEDVLATAERIEHWAWRGLASDQGETPAPDTPRDPLPAVPPAAGPPPPHRPTAHRRGLAAPAGSKLPPFLPSAKRRGTPPRRSKRGSHAGSISPSMTSPAVKRRT